MELLNAGYAVTVFDNYCNSKPEASNRVESITGKSLTRVQGDVRDRTAVIHFAGLKATGESGVKPLDYYDNNVVGSVRLLEGAHASGLIGEDYGTPGRYGGARLHSCDRPGRRPRADAAMDGARRAGAMQSNNPLGYVRQVT